MTDVFGSQHRQAWDLIPWVVNGTASDSQRQSVEEHLQSCADCREELDFQRRLQHGVARQTGPETDAHAAWARMSERLDAGSAPSVTARPGPRLHRAERTWLPWVMAAMLVQGVGLGVLGTALWSRMPSNGAALPAASGSYRTLAAPAAPAAQPTVRVVFAPTMTLDELRTVLASSHLQVVSGPSDADVWSLGPAGESTRAATDAAVRALRTSSSVRFAEPIGAAP